MLERGLFNFICRKEILYVRVLDLRIAIAAKTVGDFQHNELVSARAIENAGAIGKAAVIVAEIQDRAGGNFQSANMSDRFRYFLPISAHILHRRTTHSAGKPAQAFNATAILAHGQSHKIIPVFTRAGVEQHLFKVAFKLHACQRYFQDHTGPAAIGDDKIAATAQDKERELAGKGKGHRFGNFMFRMGINKIPCRATNLESGQRGKGDVFLGAQKVGNRVQERCNYGNEFLIDKIGARPIGGKRMYPEGMVAPMRQELTAGGIEEARTAADVENAINQKGTLMVVVNSICGCAAGRMRPGVRAAIQSGVRPDRMITVFAGQDREATDAARRHFTGFPPSSPSIALMRDGQLVYMMQRHDIETSDPMTIATRLKQAFEKHCAKAVSN